MTDDGHLADLPIDDPPAASGAPPVVAVVVTHDPGPWLEECLAALGAQDYPNLSVLVLDAASEVDPTTRVAAVLPSAYVRRVPENRGFAATANDVLNVVEGASHFVFLHDDAAPEPDALRLLVEEAYRSNAGVVAPKLVSWDEAGVLLAVGMSADKTGNTVAYGRAERDQEQHDAVRDVFVAPGGCQLVRADLFATLGGFDAGITMFGEDFDLSWRAQIAGARIVVAPSARVRHLEATVTGHRPLIGPSGPVRPDDVAEEIAALVLRHRVRAVLTAYSPVHLVRVVPQALLLMLLETVFAVSTMRHVVRAWGWNLASLAEVRAARKALHGVRLVRDVDVRRLQTRGDALLGAVMRGGLAAEERSLGVGAASRQFAGAITRGGVQLTAVVWLSLLAVLFIGSRHLFGQPIPAIGQFAPVPSDTWQTLRLFLSGWHPAGLGSSSPPPFGLFLIGAAGTLLLGAGQVLQKILVLGALPAGIVGMHRLTAPLGSWRARLVGSVLYAVVPLPYDALSRGRWSALLAYAVMPWLISRLLRASGIAPFGAPAEREDSARQRRRPRGVRTAPDAVEAMLGAEAASFDLFDTEEFRVGTIAIAGRHAAREEPIAPPPAWVRHTGTRLEQIVAASIVLALAAAFAPPIALAVLVAGLGVLVGFALTGDVRAGLDALIAAAGAVVGAGVLLIPWTFELLSPGSPWAGVAGLGIPRADAPGLGELLRLHLGDLPLGALGWGLMVAAALPLVIGRRWRLEWATRLWALAVTSWLVAWIAGRGWLGVAPPAVDVLIAPAAVAVVLAAALGLAAFELDLPGYRFGWRQLAALAAAGAGVLAALPMLGSAIDGRWGMPARDFAGLVSWMPEQVPEGDFRVLWLGAPQALPVDGWRLSDGLAYGSSRNGAPDATTLWAGSDSGPTGLLADALAVARRGETTRVGELLAPLGVRYIAVPRALAPSGQKLARHEPPIGVLDALRGQVDLRLIQTDDDLVLFENAAWIPIRAVGRQPVLDPGSSTLRSDGNVIAGDVHVAESYSSRWRLEVGGTSLPHTKAEGWANGFKAGSDGEGTLRYRTPPLRSVVLLLQLALWVAAIRAAVLALRNRAAALDAAREQPAVAGT